MNYHFIILLAIAIGIFLLYNGLKGALYIQDEEDPFIMQEKPKFEPRKVTDLSTFPKKKYYKKKKKKPTVANNAQIEKRPVGRPRKTTE